MILFYDRHGHPVVNCTDCGSMVIDGYCLNCGLVATPWWWRWTNALARAIVLPLTG